MSSKSILRALAFLIALTYCANLAYPENIDPNDDGSQYACGPKLGRINFEL